MSEKQIAGMAVDMKISLGNIIVIGTLLVSIVAGWTALQGTSSQHAVTLARHEGRLDRLEAQAGDSKDRLTRIEVTLQSMSVQMGRMLRAVEQRGAVGAPR